MAKKKSTKEHGSKKIFDTFEEIIAIAASENPKPKKKAKKKK